jgi:diamine N-acetyltransferase
MRFIDEQQYDIYASRQQRFVVEADVDGVAKAVGAIDLYDFDPQNLRAGVGVVISAEYRQAGYAKDALCALATYVKEVLHMHQLWCSIWADNEASINLFSGVGFVECGRRREWILTADGAIDEILMQKIL